MHSILRLFRRSFFVGFCVCVCSLSLPFLGCHWTRLFLCFFRLSSLSQAFCALDCYGRSVATIIVRITYAQFCWTRIQLYWPVIWSNIPFCWCASYDTINSLHHFFSLSLDSDFYRFCSANAGNPLIFAVELGHLLCILPEKGHFWNCLVVTNSMIWWSRFPPPPPPSIATHTFQIFQIDFNRTKKSTVSFENTNFIFIAR